jgi:hypothetical protein
MPSDLRLPHALEIAIAHRWRISPVLARSVHAHHSARVGVPSADWEQIEYWFAQYGRDANWLLHTGEASGVVALEIELRLAMHSLAWLAGADCSWQRSLQFTNRGRWFVLFACESGPPSLGDRYPGLRLHTSDPILIPPSRTLSGVEMFFSDPHAPLLPTPAWLTGAGRLQ